MPQSKNSWGFAWDKVDANSTAQPGAGRYLFELVKAKQGVSKKGSRYVNASCKVLKVLKGNKEDEGRIHFEYLQMTPERLGFVKGFFQDIGRGNCLMPTKGPEDAIGAMFEADVVVTQGDSGEFRNLRNIKAVSKQDVADEPEDEEEDEEEPEDDEDADEEEEEEEESDEDEDEDDPPRRGAPKKATIGRKR